MLTEVGWFTTGVLICFSLRISGAEHVHVGQLYVFFWEILPLYLTFTSGIYTFMRFHVVV